jgi:hypothetical protein
MSGNSNSVTKAQSPVRFRINGLKVKTFSVFKEVETCCITEKFIYHCLGMNLMANVTI